MMRYGFLLVLALLFLSTNAVADAAKARGGYIGGGLASTAFDDGGAFAFSDVDDSDSGITFFGGYKFFRYFAVEGRYADLGSYSVDNLSFDASVLSVHAVGIVPFGESGWELFGQLGFGTLDVDLPGPSSGNETVGSAGGGVRFSPTANFGIALQLDVWAYEDTSLGPAFDIGFGSTAVTLRYLF